MALDLKSSPDTDRVHAARLRKGRPLIELAVGHGLILATLWTPRPWQQWLYCIAVAWILVTTALAFPGWKAIGFRRGGLLRSLWVVVAAAIFSTCAIAVAIRIDTIRHPINARGWVMTFGGYV